MSAQEREERQQLDNPLVVHKESDASYNGCPNLQMLTQTRDEDEVRPTIERHRYKKKKKNPNRAKAITIVLLSAVVIVCVCVVVYFVRGNVAQRTPDDGESTSESTTESLQERFRNTITVQGTTIFFEGEEMTDVAELRNYLSLLPLDTQVIIQDEHADTAFLQTVQETVYACGFEKDPDVQYIQSSGLVPQSEQTDTSAAQ